MSSSSHSWSASVTQSPGDFSEMACDSRVRKRGTTARSAASLIARVTWSRSCRSRPTGTIIGHAGWATYDGQVVTGRGLQLTRGLTVAVAGVALPVSAHLAAGGSAALSGSTALVLALVAAVTVGVSSREWTLARLVATLVPVQALVHLSLAASGGHDGGHAAGHLGAVGSGAPVAAGISPTAAAASTSDTAMLGWHIVGLAMVVLWLRGAERALLWFVALVQRLFVRPQLLMLPMLRAIRYAASSGLGLPLPLVRTSDSRGPPHLSFT